MSIILYMLVTPALYYLGSRAVITHWLWSRYPSRLALFMDCSACSGTWYGAIVGLVGGYCLNQPFLGLDGDAWPTIIAIALCSMTWTPIIAALMQWGFETLGSAAPLDDVTQTAPDETGRFDRDIPGSNHEEFEKAIRDQARPFRAHLKPVPLVEIPLTNVPPKK